MVWLRGFAQQRAAAPRSHKVQSMSAPGFLARIAWVMLIMALTTASATAAITARVTYQTHSAYLANNNPGVGHLMFFRSDVEHTDGHYDEVANDNNARLNLPANVSNATVDLGTTAGWFTVGFNHGEAAQAMGCSTAPITFSSARRLVDGQSIDVTVTCVAPGVVPVVKAADISLSGATGTRGTYRIGDVVRASWDNTSSRGGNAGVSGVSVDFSEFGGGAAVPATNIADVWSASYTIVEGNIDAADRNVRVVASSSAGSAGAWGSNDVVVDAVAPVVSGARITLAGGSGTGGAYRIGDTVTARWDGGAGGDNNLDTIASVQLDFSAFGGGKVAASNAAGKWTAAYVIVAKAIDTTSAGVVATVVDDAGNSRSATSNDKVSVDAIAPLVTAINVIGTPAAGAAAVTFAVAFGEIVHDIDSGDFMPLSSGSVGFTSIGASVSSGNAVNVTVFGLYGNGTLGLRVEGGDHIVDKAGNPVAAFSKAGIHTVAVPRLPGAPTIGAVTVTSLSSVTVGFTPPVDDGGAAISRYQVMVMPAVSGSPFTGTSAPIAVSGLSPASTYTFQVAAINEVGVGAASAASAPVSTKHQQSIELLPRGGVVRVGDVLQVSTLARASSGLPLVLTVQTPAACTAKADGTLVITALGPYCEVTFNQPGDAQWQAAEAVTAQIPLQAGMPGAPVIGAALAMTWDGVQLDFTAPASNGGATVTGYLVTRMPGSITTRVAASPALLTGLLANTRYAFTVAAINSVGTGAPSALSAAVTTPKRPQSITDTLGNRHAAGTGHVGSYYFVATSALPVSIESTTPAVCTVDADQHILLEVVGNCDLIIRQAGDATWLAAADLSKRIEVVAVSPSVPLHPVAKLLPPNSASVGFTPQFNGGTATVDYEVIPSPAVPGARFVGTASPLSVTGLSPGTTYTFTVTASNSAGASMPSSSSNAISTTPAVSVAAVAVALPYGAPVTPIALTISGAASEVRIVSPPAHGTAVVSGMGIDYQPDAGYAGSDQLSYAAVDLYGVSAAAAVDITIDAPTLRIDTASLPAARGSSAYAQVFSASGGGAPYRYELAAGGKLPDGLSLGVDGKLQGTPRQAGSFSFSVTVTDASTGLGPFSTTRPYTLAVAAAEVTLDIGSLPPIAGGQTYDYVLQPAGGAAPYRFELVGGQLPPGLEISSGGEISGRVEAAGDYGFSVQVTDANGFNGVQLITLRVDPLAQEITGFSTDPVAPVYAEGASFTVVANGGGSSSAVVFASATPAICSVSGDRVMMLAAGNCVLRADQPGDALYSAAQQQRFELLIGLATPSLQWGNAMSRTHGEPAFDLSDPVSNSLGAFAFSSSDTTVATVNGRTVTLVGPGSTTLLARQAADGSYAAGEVALTLTVNGRPDPTTDAEVRGSLQAQVDASVRFARVQLGNIQSRLQQVRAGGNSSSVALTLAYAGDQLGQGMSLPLQMPVNRFNAMPSGWGGWMSGTATFGNSGPRNGSFDFNTDGISLGLDRSVGDSGLLGMAASLGRNRTRFDASVSRMDADQYSLAMYALWRAGEHLFVDGIVAQGRLDFDIVRWSNPANAMALGQREGSQSFAALTFGYQQQHGRYALSGYGRFDGSRSRLDGYREHGVGIYDLTYAGQTLNNSGVALGFDGSYRWQGEGLELRPFWKLEYRQSLSNSGQAWMNYVQQPTANGYMLDLQSYADNMLTLGAGLELQTRTGWLLSLLFGRDQGSSGSSSNSVGLRISYGKGATAAGNSNLDREQCAGRRCSDAPGQPGMAGSR